jgi:hypothetical protein
MPPRLKSGGMYVSSGQLPNLRQGTNKSHSKTSSSALRFVIRNVEIGKPIFTKTF